MFKSPAHPGRQFVHPHYSYSVYNLIIIHKGVCLIPIAIIHRTSLQCVMVSAVDKVKDYTTNDFGDSSESGLCSAAASYGGDEANYCILRVTLRPRIVMQKKVMARHVPRSRGDISVDRPNILHLTSPRGRKPMTLLRDQVQKPISSVKSAIKTCR